MVRHTKFPIYLVRKIKNDTAKEMIEKYHYIHKASAVNISYGLFRKDTNQFFGEKLVGVLTYGYPVGRLVHSSISPLLKRKEIIELTRLYLYDEEPKNIESFFIHQTIRRLRRDKPEIRVIIAYSDPEVKHLGIIYQASNFLYQGTKHKLVTSYWFIINGKRLHERTVIARYGSSKPEIIKKLFPNFERYPMAKKHRYLYILDKKNREEIIKTLKHSVVPYPKKSD